MRSVSMVYSIDVCTAWLVSVWWVRLGNKVWVCMYALSMTKPIAGVQGTTCHKIEIMRENQVVAQLIVADPEPSHHCFWHHTCWCVHLYSHMDAGSTYLLLYASQKKKQE